jgi:hypothetical protein
MLFVRHVYMKDAMNKSDQKPLPSLALCIFLDLVGCMSFIVPGAGEFTDVIWAPLSGLIYYKLFGGRMGVFGGFFSFFEELMPFSDIIPTFTISWFLKQRERSRSQQATIRG